jgi:hypothetical protein
VDLVERGYLGEVINFKRAGLPTGHQRPATVRLPRVQLPGLRRHPAENSRQRSRSVKRYAAQRSWLTSAVAPKRVEIRKLQGPSLESRGSIGPRAEAATLGEAGRWQSMAGLSLPAAGRAITAYWALATPQAGW